MALTDGSIRALCRVGLALARELELSFGRTSAVVQFVGGGREDYQVFSDGQLAQWMPGEATGPDLILESSSPEDVLPCCAAGVPAPAAALRWRIGDGQGLRRFPPYDMLDFAWDALPQIPGASVIWTSSAVGSPFGELPVTFDVESGQVRSIQPVHRPDATALFRFPYERSLLSRGGELSVPGILGEDGELDGDLDAVMLVAGLLEMPAWREIRELSSSFIASVLKLCDLASEGSFNVLNEALA